MTVAKLGALLLAGLLGLAACAPTNPDGTPRKAVIPPSGGYDATL